MNQRSFTAALLLLVALNPALSSCLGDDLPDTSPRPPPSSCGNNSCDPGFEDCLTCPSDCPCCSAVFADGNVSDPGNALGSADGSVVVLSELSGIVLTLGGEIFNAGDEVQSKPDFTIEGKVTSGTGGAGAAGEQCIRTEGPWFLVEVSANGRVFAPVGMWTQENASFDLGCAVRVNTARYVRVSGLPGAAGEIDAISATSCSTGGL